MRGYEAAKILKEKGITIDDVNAEIAYRKRPTHSAISRRMRPL